MYTNFFLSRPRKLALWLRTLVLWQWRLAKLGRLSTIGRAKLMNPRRIKIGTKCLIDDYAVLNGAGSPSSRITIGDHVVIREFALLEAHKGWIEVGHHSFVGHRVMVYGQGGVKIGANTMIAAGSILVSSNHNFDAADRPYKEQGETSLGIEIAENCWIAANCTILDGVKLGTGVVVAAGAIVTKSFGPGLLIAGIPAKAIKKFDSKSKKWEPVEAK